MFAFAALSFAVALVENTNLPKAEDVVRRFRGRRRGTDGISDWLEFYRYFRAERDQEYAVLILHHLFTVPGGLTDEDLEGIKILGSYIPFRIIWNATAGIDLDPRLAVLLIDMKVGKTQRLPESSPEGVYTRAPVRHWWHEEERRLSRDRAISSEKEAFLLRQPIEGLDKEGDLERRHKEFLEYIEWQHMNE